jgi:hypothetical protein
VLPEKDLPVSFDREAKFPTQMVQTKLRKKYILAPIENQTALAQ